MKTLKYQIAPIALVIGSFCSGAPVLAELSCEPKDTKISFPEDDHFFKSSVEKWSETTRNRYTEGNTKDACRDVEIAGYEGFPTKRCKYETADAGAGIFPPLAGEVIVLNPSAKQLAAWSISACRINGASETSMPKCLEKLNTHVIISNGAQFPVIGSIIESYCNSSEPYNCKDILKNKDFRLRPRHTWFRDGVSIDFQKKLNVHWNEDDYSQRYDEIFKLSEIDDNLHATLKIARLAAIDRATWLNWERNNKKLNIPEELKGRVEGHKWRKLTAYIHKSACKNTSNELFNALVFSNLDWTKK